MAENFYTILTTTGKAKIANSAALGTKVNFKTLKVGDGNGAYYEPTENQTSLINKVWEGNIGAVTVDDTNSNWIVTETTIPASDGGFFIREAGIFDEDGDLIAIAKMAATYKPVAAEGTTKDLSIRIILEVSNSSSITLKVDPNVIIATKKDIQIISNSISNIGTQLSDMVQDSYPSVIATGTNSYVGSTDKIKSLGKGTTKLTLFVGADATGNCSLNLNSYGAKNIKDSFGNIVNNFKKDIPYNLCYNGTDFILQGKGGGGDALDSQLLINKKATVDTGPIVGTMPDNGQVIIIPGAINKPINKGFHDGTGYVAGDSDLVSGNIKAGINIFGINGKSSVVDTSDAIAAAADIINGKTAYVNGNKITGTAKKDNFTTGTFNTNPSQNLRSVTIDLGFVPEILIITFTNTSGISNCIVPSLNFVNSGSNYGSLSISGTKFTFYDSSNGANTLTTLRYVAS